MHKIVIESLRRARQAAVAVIGGTVLLIGVVMVVLPGPATLVIPVGLAILATEFLWARKLLGGVRKKFRDVRNGVGNRRTEEKDAAE